MKIGLPTVHYMQYASYFNTIYVLSGVWQEAGLYMASLSSVDPELYEAGYMDGMNKLQKIYHIDLVAIRPTICIMMILQAGSVMSVRLKRFF